MANKKKSEIEDRVLVCMEKIEQLQQVAKDAQEKVRAAEQAFTKEKQLLDELNGRLTAELAELESQHRDRSANVEPALLARYTKLKASRKDQPLAAIKGGMCAGCRLQIPPQLVAEVKRSQDLHTCPYCHRMLYWDGDAQEERPSNPSKRSDLEVGESV
jgi:predicted  nucleic acid-binding Zn-ribbon protein